MLVLSRKASQQIQIGRNITVTVVRVEGQKVRIGIDAPADVHIVRAEIADKPPTENDAESQTMSAKSCSPPARRGLLQLPTEESAEEDSLPRRPGSSRRNPDARRTTGNRTQVRLGPAALCTGHA